MEHIHQLHHVVDKDAYYCSTCPLVLNGFEIVTMGDTPQTWIGPYEMVPTS